MSFAHLFTPHEIRDLEIRNRIGSSSRQTVMARNWCPADDIAAYHEVRAAGGAGQIVTEAACTRGEGAFESVYIDDSTDAHFPGFRKSAEAAHRQGCEIFGQLSNGGRRPHHLRGDGHAGARPGRRPVVALEVSLRGRGLEMHWVGDRLSPQTVEEAVYEGMMAAREV